LPRSPEIDRLKAALNQAFSAKQTAFDRMKPLGDRRHALKEEMDASWNKVQSARTEMNSAHERQQFSWEVYKSEHDRISTQIDAATKSADDAHEAMKNCFDRAHDAYAYGSKADAAYYSSEGKEYRERRNDFNAEKARLISIAKSMTPPNSDFHYHKDHYDSLMQNHKNLQSEYQKVKAHHETAKNEFEMAKKHFEQTKAAYDQAIESERAKWYDSTCAECGAAIRINREWSRPPKYCKSCTEKFEQRRRQEEETTNRIKADWESLRAQAKSYDSGHKAGYYEPEYGWINGHPVTFSIGFGNNEGHTLLADGHIDKETFNQHGNHNHYGPGRGAHDNVKDRKKYSGPGA
jgi:multidrug resistance efflux pump